jgi:hypothetical protein
MGNGNIIILMDRGRWQKFSFLYTMVFISTNYTAKSWNAKLAGHGSKKHRYNTVPQKLHITLNGRGIFLSKWT